MRIPPFPFGGSRKPSIGAGLFFLFMAVSIVILVVRTILDATRSLGVVSALVAGLLAVALIVVPFGVMGIVELREALRPRWERWARSRPR